MTKGERKRETTAREESPRRRLAPEKQEPLRLNADLHRRQRSHSIGRADGPQGPARAARIAALEEASALAHAEADRLEAGL